VTPWIAITQPGSLLRHSINDFPSAVSYVDTPHPTRTVEQSIAVTIVNINPPARVDYGVGAALGIETLPRMDDIFIHPPNSSRKVNRISRFVQRSPRWRFENTDFYTLQ
jgi:hypothetical protein